MAFTAYDSETEPILDPSYGRIVFNSYQWGDTDKEGNYLPTEIKEIETHTCSSEELGLQGDTSSFYQIRESSIPNVRNY